MSLRERFNENQRLLILQALREDTDYTLNEIMLQIFLAEVGERISIDLIRTHLSWLAEQGLVTVEKVREMHIGKITNHGVDVACGVTRQPGVARPRPE